MIVPFVAMAKPPMGIGMAKISPVAGKSPVTGKPPVTGKSPLTGNGMCDMESEPCSKSFFNDNVLDGNVLQTSRRAPKGHHATERLSHHQDVGAAEFKFQSHSTEGKSTNASHCKVLTHDMEGKSDTCVLTQKEPESLFAENHIEADGPNDYIVPHYDCPPQLVGDEIEASLEADVDSFLALWFADSPFDDVSVSDSMWVNNDASKTSRVNGDVPYNAKQVIEEPIGKTSDTEVAVISDIATCDGNSSNTKSDGKTAIQLPIDRLHRESDDKTAIDRVEISDCKPELDRVPREISDCKPELVSPATTDQIHLNGARQRKRKPDGGDNSICNTIDNDSSKKTSNVKAVTKNADQKVSVTKNRKAQAPKHCKHGRQPRYCKECGGAGLCEAHGRRRSTCKECGGSSVCEHGRQRSQCRECGGASICEHGRLRCTCKECGGGSLCTHGCRRSLCKMCGGGGVCEHGRRRSKCKECAGSGVCMHGRWHWLCKDCGGASVCEHGRLRHRCKDCGGKGICEHGRERSKCKECGGSCICEHGRERAKCKECISQRAAQC